MISIISIKLPNNKTADFFLGINHLDIMIVNDNGEFENVWCSFHHKEEDNRLKMIKNKDDLIKYLISKKFATSIKEIIAEAI